MCPTLQISFGEWSAVVWQTKPSFSMLTIAWKRFVLNYGNQAYRIGWVAVMSQWMFKSSAPLGTGEVKSQVLVWNWKVASFEMTREITSFWVCFAEVGILMNICIGSNCQLKLVSSFSTYHGSNLLQNDLGFQQFPQPFSPMKNNFWDECRKDFVPNFKTCNTCYPQFKQFK